MIGLFKSVRLDGAGCALEGFHGGIRRSRFIDVTNREGGQGANTCAKWTDDR